MHPIAPDDVEIALSTWGATCGPAALAAALGLPLAAVRDAVCSGTPPAFKGYMGVSDMLDACSVLRVKVERIQSKVPAAAELDLLAREGPPRLVLVQWRGPWEAHARAAATHRHWIANLATADETWIYDVNEDDWMLFERWRDELVPLLLPARATGWRIAWSAEVHR